MAAASSAINNTRGFSSSSSLSSSVVRHPHYKWSHPRTCVCLCRHQFRAPWMLPARRGTFTALKVRGMGQLYRLHFVRRCFLGIHGISGGREGGAPLLLLLRDRMFRSRLFINKRGEASIISELHLNKGKLRNNEMLFYD